MGMLTPARSDGASSLVSEGEQGAGEVPNNQAKINYIKKKMSRGTKCCSVPYLSWQPLRAPDSAFPDTLQ